MRKTFFLNKTKKLLAIFFFFFNHLLEMGIFRVPDDVGCDEEIATEYIRESFLNMKSIKMH